MTKVLCAAFFVVSLAGPSIALATNMPPTVAINGYGMGPESVYACASAEAADPNGSIVKIEFYANDQKIGESTSPPYCYQWYGPVGVYTIKAVATDNKGVTGTSAPITVEIRQPFVAHLVTPTNGQVFVAGEQIPMTARTEHGEGTISLRYSFDGYTYGSFPELTNAPYEFTMTAYALGTHSISGVAVQEGWNPNRDAWLRPVTIYVIPARGFPVISNQPTNQIVPAGTNAVLSISAFAELPVWYQWRFNNIDLANATNEQLLLTNVSREQAGAYSVLVSTAAGALLSEAGFLDVLPPTAGTIRFANRVVDNGEQLVDAPFSLPGSNFIARLWAGPRPQVMELVEPVLTFSNSAYFDGGAWSIPTVAPGETAYVQIDVQDVSDGPYGPVTYSRMLAVQAGGADAPAPLPGLTFSPAPAPLTPDPYFPYFFPQMRDSLEMGTFGSEHTLQISFGTYAERVTYQWQKDGRDIPGAAGMCEKTGHPSTRQYCRPALVLKNLQLGDIARYRVRVDTGSTKVVSPALLVALMEPPGGRFVEPAVRNGMWQAQLRGRLGQKYFIQSSANLLDWINCSTVTNVEGTVALEAPTDPSGKRFYRALALP